MCICCTPSLIPDAKVVQILPHDRTVTLLEGGPLLWVATHRKHHRYADKEGDPPSSRDGKWWLHAGWILVGSQFAPGCCDAEKTLPDLAKDKANVWLMKYHLVSAAVAAASLFAMGGFGLVLCGTFLRTSVGLHPTWLVNSVAHIWGGPALTLEIYLPISDAWR